MSDLKEMLKGILDSSIEFESCTVGENQGLTMSVGAGVDLHEIVKSITDEFGRDNIAEITMKMPLASSDRTSLGTCFLVVRFYGDFEQGVAKKYKVNNK